MKTAADGSFRRRPVRGEWAGPKVKAPALFIAFSAILLIILNESLQRAT